MLLKLDEIYEDKPLQFSSCRDSGFGEDELRLLLDSVSALGISWAEMSNGKFSHLYLFRDDKNPSIILDISEQRKGQRRFSVIRRTNQGEYFLIGANLQYDMALKIQYFDDGNPPVLLSLQEINNEFTWLSYVIDASTGFYSLMTIPTVVEQHRILAQSPGLVEERPVSNEPSRGAAQGAGFNALRGGMKAAAHS